MILRISKQYMTTAHILPGSGEGMTSLFLITLILIKRAFQNLIIHTEKPIRETKLQWQERDTSQL
jgi:hypothetical protein